MTLEVRKRTGWTYPMRSADCRSWVTAVERRGWFLLVTVARRPSLRWRAWLLLRYLIVVR